MLFDMLEYMPLTDFMTILTTLGISLYFVTSSDSASAVIDQIASNGETEGPVWQRMFWAITEGLTATVVLYAIPHEGLSIHRASDSKTAEHGVASSSAHR